tara:strand:+ start:2331 stop:2501 length:171 start_codon:yes stop_codon:yes gene_type:complete
MIDEKIIKEQIKCSLYINIFFLSLIALMTTPWVLIGIPLKVAANFDMKRRIKRNAR